MKIVYKVDKMKIIKANSKLPTDKLCKKLKMTSSELHRFCVRNNMPSPNNIKNSTDKKTLNFIINNPKMSMALLVRKTGFNQVYLSELLTKKGISDDRFTKNINDIKKITHIRKEPVRLCTTRVERKLHGHEKITTKNKGVVYNKLSHEELNNILLSANNVDNKFKRDLGALGIGEALHIKKENWILGNRPYFYFTKITKGSGIKVKVREIEDNIYVIRLK